VTARAPLVVLALLGAAFFGWAAAMQTNDPDPVRWIAIYGGAGAVFLGVAAAPRAWPVAIVIALVASGWAGVLFLGLERFANWDEITTSMPMHGGPVEETREGLGLTLVALWAVAVATLGRLVARRARG
jgi:hypothetical protein